MRNIDDVIKDWESVLSADPLDAPWDLIDETLELLKKQKAVEPKTNLSKNDFRYDFCGSCGELLPITTVSKMANFCPCCGKAVKWE